MIFNDDLGGLTSYPINYLKVDFTPQTELVVSDYGISDYWVRKTNSKISIKIDTRAYTKTNFLSNGKTYAKYTFNNIEPTGTVLEMAVLESESIIFESYIFPSAIALLNENRSLTPQEIAFVRTQIELVADETEKGDLYLRLQTKIKYRNQRDNYGPLRNEVIDAETSNKSYTWTSIDIADVMCNLTSIAMAFETLGVSREDVVQKISDLSLTLPDNLKDAQTEDLFEFIRVEQGFDLRTSSESWRNIAGLFDLETEEVDIYSSKKANQQISTLINHLKQGKGIVVSLYSGNGHIVLLQNISDAGLQIDDPYGIVNNMAKREFNLGGGYDKNVAAKQTIEENTDNINALKGEDNLLIWDEIDVK